ncbi:MAG: hypothetical protein A3I07_03765 [Candidatus Doudnabacteria bacterium RIFCSPLOWO2_02_FULL_42_9]|uniref:Uncharacterized protein n=1 Tax=Candidatus Doudnabacteria bacterium RIFCSPHIGHO2_01_FULL_41_86 TaxID=1817821 RepID=A0A1F5N8N4_9BACT|nr:MAG: hypothetical protein A2717_00545 [Candidatus Doudnabacteria bacterium RIFCSPHIGHO2_01_FULL_41_86]OGE75144.1 MAG: hypothetical protein A3K07_01505 [Candidatus Doudnabacteria bacterium RIFCSPHIGHO2_01_43_10]OGE86431.1 MAG: hypothetical protein A3E28_00420 [Candidatus Doudnabacteria bacterium RIFCSPHIGHO2_12_FULL_42_22]OGE87430.1 MAG: hypothetical protein A3C49_04405 [Candidatus Doudnabacteria bacterium RIFCSPHIGHO2_02_FULL_42_25]OGE92728.1 MAG: hypothetical protein A2895_03900 [Candidatus
MKKISTSKIASIVMVAFVLTMAIAPVGSAAWVNPQCTGTGLPCQTSITDFIMNIINIALTVAGLIAVLFLIIGGFRYITSAGNEETAENAKKIIINAIIGIVIIILSFVIVRVISEALVRGNT